MMKGFIWKLLLFMAVTALLDLLLVVVYMNWLHPWRDILEDARKSISLGWKTLVSTHRVLRFGHLSLMKREKLKFPFRAKAVTTC